MVHMPRSEDLAEFRRKSINLKGANGPGKEGIIP